MKLKLFFIFLLAIFASAAFAAASYNVTLYYFWGDGCPHCAAAEPFISGLGQKYPFLTIEKFEVWHFPENALLFVNFSNAHGVDKKGTPGMFLGGQTIIGWDSDMAGARLETLINFCHENFCPDSWEITTGTAASHGSLAVRAEELVLSLPLIGAANLNGSPLALISLSIGFLDALNPCTTWVVVYILALFVLVREQKSLALLAAAFLLTYGLIYYLVLAGWLNPLSLIGYLPISRWILGLGALGAGIYGLLSLRNGTSPTGIANPVVIQSLLLLLIVFAFSVTILEYICSSGLPDLFGRVLASQTRSPLEAQLYRFLYLLAAMSGYLLVFAISISGVSALKHTGEKNIRLAHLLSGALLLFLALMLLVFPSTLQFA
ncbi:hypothetical protein COT30_03065 [Candidatus Micrarchaeota archaeon CG08_land_8_20_14_0_20_49_17]|nr:MAG: hypothetical protein AUJ13_02470 [Candidatus Micrarchaeota archaeon CG1_02_49_24]PIU09691.1 MAG: hypothetical protein COT30_03065 [Candidatus Micrarchaeota archaeon CG08_land_8_20_14_0_20_49_17]PIZ95402.1 MAG: hypothetical protein COX84_04515 [Candidatus Micrarchaeota archaeon CG_4_10_14_0_2_um_filter_49_7]HII53390.1 thioredoxin family protein [Candidatus Micrarchaeota archaeon]